MSRTGFLSTKLLSASLALVILPALAGSQDLTASDAGAGKGPGLAIHCAKVLTMDGSDRVLNRGVILVRGGRIEALGHERDIEVPEGFAHFQAGELWAWPGMVDLHSHVIGTWDINDMVLPVNPELSTRPSYIPSNPALKLACASGVTTIHGIPGSGTSIGGFGGLWKTKTEAKYDETVLKFPGGMKSAFNFNPQRGGGDLGASWAGLTWTVQQINNRALGRLAQGVEDAALANLMRVHQGELPVLVHCASAEGVAGVVRTWKLRYDTEVVVSHGSWDGHLAAAFCAEHGVPVNHGPRILNFNSMVREGRVVGGAKSYMDAGVPLFSLNTDSPVVPQEELFLQATMSARLGADAYQMLRAVTAHPAESFLVGDRIGSLAPGKDADIVLTTGDPLDPRCRVEWVWIDGELQYSRERDGQWF